LGRADDQVKIRGYRIELGEIEAALIKISGIKECITVVQKDAVGENRLISYLTTDPNKTGQTQMRKSAEHKRKDEWQEVYKTTYGNIETSDISFNIVGWNSTYTLDPIPESEMHEWQEKTIDRIKCLSPKTIWEIGCGTGLLMWKLIDGIKKYYGTDLSSETIDFLREELLKKGITNAYVEQRFADDPPDFNEGGFELVVINSVIQYFPSATYLQQVIGYALRVANRAVFAGDLRSLAHHRAFITSVELFQAGDQDLTKNLAQKITERIHNERELLVDPFFFSEIAKFENFGVVSEVQIKESIYSNEMSRWRYDITLHKIPNAKTIKPTISHHWSELAEVRKMLANLDLHESVEILNIPNARVAADVWASDRIQDFNGTVKELKDHAFRATKWAINPDILYEIARELNLNVRVMWSQSRLDSLHALFTKEGSEIQNWYPEGKRFPHSLTNDPLRKILEANLVDTIKSSASKTLPDFMIPSTFVVLDRLPLTFNGKIDRKALPDPSARRSATLFRAPNSEEEYLLCNIFSELTGVDPVGVDDSFFGIGGHSLLAMRLIARLRQETGCHLPLRLLFTHPSPAGLAPHINNHFVRYNPLIPLRKDGTETPLFCVHPAGGMGTVYGHLMGYLDEDQPVWALQAKGLEGNEEVHSSIAEMASAYVEAIKDVQSRGPYRLLGWSFGGAVCQEMAAQLEAQGETVEAIFMLDSVAQVYEKEFAESKNIDKAGFLDKLLLAIAKDCDTDLDSLLSANEDKLTILKNLMVKSGLLPYGIAVETAERVMQQMAMSPARLGGHRIKQCEAPIILFRALVDANPDNDHLYKWDQFTSGSVSIYDIPYSHSQMVSPLASQIIAQIIEKTLLAN
jgi:thioesterase domain-containing protein/ubiquinone/menaquinone biosynthesis C-methylase UbiE